MSTVHGVTDVQAKVIDLDDHTTWLVRHLAANGPASAGAATALVVEKLRRLEDLARSSGADRQVLQKILSARRVLGDDARLGPEPSFAQNPVAMHPVPKALMLPGSMPEQWD